MPTTRRLPANPSLLGAVRAGAHDRILVIGAPARAADLMGDAIRRGCRGAAAFVAPPARPEPAEVVVAPRVETAEAGLAIAAVPLRSPSAAAPGRRRPSRPPNMPVPSPAPSKRRKAGCR